MIQVNISFGEREDLNLDKSRESDKLNEEREEDNVWRII